MPRGVEALSLFEDQCVCLAPVTTALDDEVPATEYGPGRLAPAECLLCARAVEDCQHVFFVCSLTQAVWQAVGVGRLVVTSEEAFWQSLDGGTIRREAEWQTIFATLWSL